MSSHSSGSPTIALAAAATSSRVAPGNRRRRTVRTFSRSIIGESKRRSRQLPLVQGPPDPGTHRRRCRRERSPEKPGPAAVPTGCRPPFGNPRTPAAGVRRTLRGYASEVPEHEIVESRKLADFVGRRRPGSSRLLAKLRQIQALLRREPSDYRKPTHAIGLELGPTPILGTAAVLARDRHANERLFCRSPAPRPPAPCPNSSATTPRSFRSSPASSTARCSRVDSARPWA